MSLRPLTAALVVLPLAAGAQTAPELSFSVGLGGRVAPDYFGSEDYSLGPTGRFSFGHLRLGRFEVGDPDPDAVAMGWRPRGSFRLIGERTADDNAELAGLEDIDLSVELGGGVGYQSEEFAAFADLRYGVIGHEAWVAELGADLIDRRSPKLTLTIGPRLLIGSEKYAETYFGVTAAESVPSSFAAYDPGAGPVTYGIEIGATYALNDRWSLDGEVTWDRLTGDAADSPIVQSEDVFGVSLVLMRRFTFGG